MKGFTEVTYQEYKDIEVGGWSSFFQGASKILGLVGSTIIISAAVLGIVKTWGSETGEFKTKEVSFKWSKEMDKLHAPIYYTY